MATKTKTHRFTVEVKTYRSRKDAERAILLAFAKRQPDFCKFCILPANKDPWKAGIQAGYELGRLFTQRKMASLKKAKP